MGKLVLAAAASGAPMTALSATGSSIALDTALVEWRRDPLGVDSRRPRLRWTLKATDPAARNLVQSAYRVRILGAEGSKATGAVIWDSGLVTSQEMAARPPRDLPFESLAAYEWRLALRDGDGRLGAETRAGRFVTGLFSEQGWAAPWIAASLDAPVSPLAKESAKPPAKEQGDTLPVFRGEFTASKTVARAYLSVVGLGCYDFRINGVSVAADTLAPAWTDYRHRVLYDTYDVTALIKPGVNAMAVMLGNGMYTVEVVKGRYSKFGGSFGQPKVRATLRILFADDSETRVGTGPEWRTRPGPVTFSSIHGGEDHDARTLVGDWDLAGQPADDWNAVSVVEGPGGKLAANPTPAVRIMRTIAPVAVTSPRTGVLVYDFGENFAGVPQLTLRGVRSGQKVTLWPGELLLADGTLDQRSATGGPPGLNGIAFNYVARGGAVEVWRPRFTYAGYRYLQVEGATRDQIATLQGCVVHMDLDKVGAFECSDPQLVRIHSLIEQALLSNMVSVLTDCPHREKLGWLEQVYLNAPTVLFNRDAVTLYEKMIGDMADAQTASGMMPSIAPEYVAFINAQGRDTTFRDTPEWGSAIVLATWAVYRAYGDRGVLEAAWPAMQRYVDYLGSRAVDGVISYGLGDWYDVGPAKPGRAQLTSLAMTGTATYYADLVAMEAMARILGQPKAAMDYAGRAAATKAVINTRLYDAAKGVYNRGSQCANAMALVLRLPPEAERARVINALVGDIRARNDHVTAGDIGFHYLVRALTEAGRADVLYAILSRTDPPSYGAQLAAGATALTEAWDASRDSSQNHFMLGHIESWFYGGLGGVAVDRSTAARRPIRIAPQPVAGVASTSVSHRSVLGLVKSRWRREQDLLTLEVTIPPGATATVVVPAATAAAVRESGKSLSRRDGLLAVTRSPGAVDIDVGSGRYVFTVAA